MEPGRIEFIHRSWPADPTQLAVIRHELASWIAPLRLTDDETADVVLAVDEAAANAVLHAYGPDESGAVELTLWTEPGPGTSDATLFIDDVELNCQGARELGMEAIHFRATDQAIEAVEAVLGS